MKIRKIQAALVAALAICTCACTNTAANTATTAQADEISAGEHTRVTTKYGLI